VSLGKLKYVVLVGDENFYLPYFTKIQPINDYGSGDNSTDMIILWGRRGCDRMVVTNVVSLNPTHGKVYSIQDYVMKFVSNLRQVGGFLRLSVPL
jgi:hypothetical protein